jgi:general secretion pathway protein D
MPTDRQPIAREAVIPAPMAEREKEPERPAGATGPMAGATRATVISPTPPLTVEPPKRAQPAAPTAPFPADEPRNTSLNFDQTPLPTFIQVVFGNVLKSNVLIDPAVAQRQDLVTVRTGKPQNRAEVLETTRLLLKTYGVAVVDIGGVFRVVPDSAATAFNPEIRRGRALPDVPQPLRPVYQFYDLEAVRVQDAAQWLKTIFGNRIQFTEDQPRNALLISGMADSVANVIESLQVLDQPMLRGRSSIRIEPAYWTADELARKLAEVLTAQGFSVGTAAGGNQPILLLPIVPINSIIAFAVAPSALEHVARWVRELDQPGTGRAGGAAGLFTYSARNTDARELAKTLQELIGTTAPPAAPGQPPRPVARVVVNAATNTLIFQGAPDTYTQFISLLQELDRPARTALIEVTVAEVRLGDREALGIEWALGDATVNNSIVRAGTLGGLGIGTGGLTVRVLSSAGQTRALINALASTNRARVLSSPRLMARNGETASIQVGQEVPVITSQQTTSTGAIGGAILQTVQYRQTGVILRVRPIIHSGGRIELDVVQEVSSAEQTSTGVNISPTISTRKVETKLALGDGTTALLAGLISQNDSRSDSGIPVLKDIPLIGQLFRTNTDVTDRTELIVLITPYLVNNDFEVRSFTEAFRSQLGPWAAPKGSAAVVLPPAPQPVDVTPVPRKPAEEEPVPESKDAAKPAQPSSKTDAEPAKPPAQQAPEPAKAAPESGRKVEDPKLLEELQRAIQQQPPAKK